MTTHRFTYTGEAAVKGVVAHLVSLSAWFRVTPLPDNEWAVEVKSDVAHLMPRNSEQIAGEQSS